MFPKLRKRLETLPIEQALAVDATKSEANSIRTALIKSYGKHVYKSKYDKGEELLLIWKVK